MKKSLFILFLIFIYFRLYGVDYSQRLLTDTYGIITEKDLAYDASRRKSLPYNPNKFAGGVLYWQCFPVKAVKVKYRTWEGDDEWVADNPVKTMCDLEFIINYNNEIQIYSGRRAYPIEHCRHVTKEYEKVTKGQKIVCFDGEDGSYLSDEKIGKFKSWTWDKIKTKKGCYSYFEGDCLNKI